jgi:hypothetical protein
VDLVRLLRGISAVPKGTGLPSRSKALELRRGSYGLNLQAGGLEVDPLQARRTYPFNGPTIDVGGRPSWPFDGGGRASPEAKVYPMPRLV